MEEERYFKNYEIFLELKRKKEIELLVDFYSICMEDVKQFLFEKYGVKLFTKDDKKSKQYQQDSKDFFRIAKKRYYDVNFSNFKRSYIKHLEEQAKNHIKVAQARGSIMISLK